MQSKTDNTQAPPRFIARHALVVLLASGAGCIGDAVELDRDGDLNRESGEESSQPSGYTAIEADASVTFTGPDTCDPGTPTFDPGKPDYPKPVDAGVPPPPDAGRGPVRNCTGHLLGGGKLCVSHADVKLQGAALCAALGQELTDLKLGDENCPGGSTDSWVSCCEPEPPAPSVCSGGVIGDGKRCIDWTSIKLQANAACQVNGGGLIELIGGSDDASCSTGALWAKYTCCGAAPPKPANLDDDGVWLK